MRCTYFDDGIVGTGWWWFWTMPIAKDVISVVVTARYKTRINGGKTNSNLTKHILNGSSFRLQAFQTEKSEAYPYMWR